MLHIDSLCADIIITVLILASCKMEYGKLVVILWLFSLFM